MKQRFKGEVLSKRKCINNLLRYYRLANASELIEGMNWYNDAKQYATELAARFNITLSQVVGIIAAFSPQTGWAENKRYVLSFLINPKVGLKSEVQNSKARAILNMNNETDIYNALSLHKDGALKTKAFFLNILNPDVITDVTIDRHAVAASIQHPDSTEALPDNYRDYTKKQYNFLESCYVDAANEMNILPQQLQAIVWTVYRRQRDLKEHVTTNDWKPFSTNVTF
jgi:hypothetical protein